MQSFFSLFLFLLLSGVLNAQSTNGLVAWLSFDKCETFDDSNNRNHGYFSTQATCRCGVSGQALEINGETDVLKFDEALNPVLNSSNFSISFYFKPYRNANYYTLFSRSKECMKNPMLEAWMGQGFLNVVYRNGKYYLIEEFVSETCWKHLVFVRNEFGIEVYINGNLVAESSRRKAIDFSDDAVLTFGTSPCLNRKSLGAYKGLMDEIRVYNRSLNAAEVNELFQETYTNNMILNQGESVCAGEAVQIETQGICPRDQVTWYPETGLSDASNPNPIIRPEFTETYTLEVNDGSGSLCLEQIEIEVQSPIQLNLGEEKLLLCKNDSLFINAYSPEASYRWQDGSTEAQMLIKSAGRYWVEVSQGGCQLSDTIYVSDRLCGNEKCTFNFPDSFTKKEGFKASGCAPNKWLLKMYDLNGGLIFETKQFEKIWDGNYQGKELNSGKYLWQLVFENETKTIQYMKGFVDLKD